MHYLLCGSLSWSTEPEDSTLPAESGFKNSSCLADERLKKKKCWRSRISGGSGDGSMCPVTVHELCTVLR